jgi:hypothetical protein
MSASDDSHAAQREGNFVMYIPEEWTKEGQTGHWVLAVSIAKKQCQLLSFH